MPFLPGRHLEARVLARLAVFMASCTIMPAGAADLTAEAINSSVLSYIAADPGADPESSATNSNDVPSRPPSPPIIRLQVLLDREGTSPGVIDGYNGANLRKAIAAFKAMHGLPADNNIGPDVVEVLDTGGPVIGSYVVAKEDIAGIVDAIPADYADQAKMKRLGFTSAAEALAEQFHMDIDLLKALNPRSQFRAGDKIVVANVGSSVEGEVAKVEVSKGKGQLRAIAPDGTLVATYPATIGSDSNPSPSGIHIVKTIVENPTYTYNPKVNFQQGENDEVLTLPAGPNGPVGSMWIDLSEPTFGIHGTPEPSRIDKTGSHGCVRLTNWDARELGSLLAKGVPVEFFE